VSGVSVSGCQYDGIYVGDGASTTVENCVVRTVGSTGIFANTIRGCVALDCGYSAISGQQVSDSRGQSVGGGYGLFAYTALNCYGYSSSYYGLSASTAQNCYGYSSSGTGLYAYTAQNCYGSSSSGTGLYAAYTAQNCYGYSVSGTGLYAGRTAIGCYGESSGGPRGLYAQSAAFCVAYNTGTAIEAFIANGCWAEAGTNLITNKYNMP
jgi:hypothetical protein